MKSKYLLLAVVALSGVIGACGSDGDTTTAGDKGAEEEVPTDGKLDSFFNPKDHGKMEVNSTVEGKLEESARFHAWSFQLSGDAKVALRTGAVTGSSIDTVLYLYKLNDNGTWGSYLAKNDNEPSGSAWSLIEKEAGKGTYRILVKGYHKTDLGKFSLKLECSGDGCAAPAATRLRVPLIDDGKKVLVSSYNKDIKAAGLPEFPDTVWVTGDSAGRDEYSKWADLNDKFYDVPALENIEIIRYSDPESYQIKAQNGEDRSLCFEGDVAAAAGTMANLADNVFSDQFVIWGWRYGTFKGWSDSYTLEELEADYFPTEWKEFEGSKGSVLVVWTTSDSGDDPTASEVFPCK